MNARTRVAVVGAGWAGGLHLEGFRRADAELVGVFSRTRSRAEDLAARYGVPVVADTLDELLSEARPDVVSIASPPPAHHEQVLQAVEAGCHVLCDKPVGMTAGEVQDMLTAATKKGVQHATGFIWRGDPGLSRMRDLVRGGRVGRVREVHSTCALGAPRMAMNWIYDESEGGGGLMQHGTHVIDRLRWLLDAEFTSLCGRLSHDVRTAPVGPEFHNTLDAFAWARDNHGRDHEAVPRAEVTADVGYDVLAELSNGVRVRLWESTHLTGPAEEEVTVIGDEGALTWGGTDGLTFRPTGGAAQPLTVDGMSGSGANTRHEVGLRRWERLATSFLASVRTGTPQDHPTLEDGWHVARIVDAVKRSHATRCWEEV
ncbi:Gfo/Idh/MocA family oxidoreductase [Streptomyces sp. SID12488]|uniref:Gfo/Idh/MocA family protein n=1 Tax=Streptomyces sp. SID12488 TaxID=2706040 RepID=UPI0013D9666F|nr:Gfo/Idh/MocA family oxidoreductase [Streptomyces sp. SID12488]NEA63734.1 Gfo/Idh/MocA family oxidoreductase [Streptomyces sp. SID12488]